MDLVDEVTSYVIWMKMSCAVTWLKKTADMMVMKDILMESRQRKIFDWFWRDDTGVTKNASLRPP